MDFSEISNDDQEIFSLLKQELLRQQNNVELIASENFVTKNVMTAMGTWLTNKYSEGYPGKRYYGGNEYIDQIENIAIARAKKLFNAEHANVQSHSGSQANQAAYFALMNPHDKIMGMSLPHGGHLTHGSKVNFSGKFFNFISYGVSEKDHLLNYDELRKIALQQQPKVILAGYTAYPRNIDFKLFKEIADSVGAYLMADISHFAGIVAARKHMMPFPYCDVITTTTHKTLRGPRGAMILSKADSPLVKRFNPGTKRTLSKMIDSGVFPGSQGGPLDHIIAAKAIALKEADSIEFQNYISRVLLNSKALANELMNQDFKLITDGTDNHLVLIDLTNKNVTGSEAEKALDVAGITCNKNTVPFDSRSPFNPSGLRLGTPAITTRGFTSDDVREVARLISKVISNINDVSLQKNIKQQIQELCSKYPLYPTIKV